MNEVINFLNTLIDVANILWPYFIKFFMFWVMIMLYKIWKVLKTQTEWMIDDNEIEGT